MMSREKKNRFDKKKSDTSWGKTLHFSQKCCIFAVEKRDAQWDRNKNERGIDTDDTDNTDIFIKSSRTCAQVRVKFLDFTVLSVSSVLIWHVKIPLIQIFLKTRFTLIVQSINDLRVNVKAIF